MTNQNAAIRKEISEGIEKLRVKYGFPSFYAFSKSCKFKSNVTLKGVHLSGNITFKTLAQVGNGLGFEGDNFDKARRVLAEMGAE